MSIVNELTGEVYEIPETTDLVEQQNNKLIADMFTDQVDEMYAQYEYWKQQKELFEHKLLHVCAANGIRSVDNDYFRITHVPEHTAKKVDTELMKKAGIYDAFTKEVPVKESIRVKIK